jgi:hypothetical protein
MSVCPRCFQSFLTVNWLKKHLEKTVPCDFKCKQCDFKGKDRHHYYRHQKSHQSKNNERAIVPIQEKDDEVLALQPVENKKELLPERIEQKYAIIPKEVIPLEDFNWKCLPSPEVLQRISDHLKIKIEDIEKIFDYDLKKIAAYMGYPIEDIERIEITDTVYDERDSRNGDLLQGYQRRTRFVLRAERARRALPKAVGPNILQCLCGPCDLAELMYEVLHNVHAQREHPGLLSMRLRDLNRKNVEFLTRPQPDDECFWITNTNSVAIQKIRKHCDELFNFTLVSAIEALSPVMAIRNDGPPVIYLMSANPEPDNIKHKAFSLIKNRGDEIELSYDLVNPEEVVSIGVTNKDVRVNDFINQIKAKIEEDKQEILAKFTDVILDDKRINEFFERAKEAATVD